MQKKIFNFFKGIYKKLPVNNKQKQALKSTFYKCFGFAFKNTASYRVWNSINLVDKPEEIIEFDMSKIKGFETDKKIAVHIHLFYVDLLEEFCQYLGNMPYKFDVLVSVTDESSIDMVTERLKELTMVNGVTVKKVENRGRDVAPFLSSFGKDVLNYDYICHVHSKKSLYTGSEQTEWRKHLLDGLFISDIHIRKIFYIMENKNVGMVYPETFIRMPYCGHTWLRNTASRDELLERIGVDSYLPETYFDYPMGTMFWAKVDAIRQFFEADIKTGEFPAENKQNDGTIAHAFERCLGHTVYYNGYNLAVYDDRSDTFSLNNGQKNFYQYWSKSSPGLVEEVQNYDVISFDIFDTLLVRLVYSPKDVWKLSEKKFDSGNGTLSNFARLRADAEKNARLKSSGKDICIDDIYVELQKMSGLSHSYCEELKQLELDTEKSVLVPRKEIKEAFNSIVNNSGKEVILVSDMYLGKDFIEGLLKDNGITGYSRIYISCEENARKDDGTLWQKVKDDYNGKSILHVGDNEVSDVQIPGDFGIENYHVMSPKVLLENSNIYKNVRGQVNSEDDRLIMGLFNAKLFNSPFVMNGDRFKLKIKDAYTFGYCFMGPVVNSYVRWVCNEASKNGADNILFFAREGYVLEKVFKAIKDNSAVNFAKNVNGKYLLVSRRAMSVARCKDETTIDELLDIFYLGNFKNLLQSRFGIKAFEDEEDFEVKLPDNKAKVKRHLEKYISAILNKADEERKSYLSYFNNIVGEGDRFVFSDIGYSGSIQYFLSELLGKATEGYYFATDDVRKGEKYPGNKMYGYYIENDGEREISTSAVHRYNMILESVLIAPVGQLEYIGEDGLPVYKYNENPAFNRDVEEVQRGITDFAADYARLCVHDEGDFSSCRNISEKLYESIIKYDIVDESLAKSFVVEDGYCRDEIMSVFEYYNNR